MPCPPLLKYQAAAGPYPLGFVYDPEIKFCSHSPVGILPATKLASIQRGGRILSEDEKKGTGEAGKKIGRGEGQRTKRWVV